MCEVYYKWVLCTLQGNHHHRNHLVIIGRTKHINWDYTCKRKVKTQFSKINHLPTFWYQIIQQLRQEKISRKLGIQNYQATSLESIMEEPTNYNNNNIGSYDLVFKDALGMAASKRRITGYMCEGWFPSILFVLSLLLPFHLLIQCKAPQFFENVH